VGVLQISLTQAGAGKAAARISTEGGKERVEEDGKRRRKSLSNASAVMP